MSFSSSGANFNVSAERRMVLLGARCTGKSSLIERAIDDNFSDTYTPTIESNVHVWQTRGSQTISVDIIDTGGLDAFTDGMFIPSHLCVGVDFYVLVYSVASHHSFLAVQEIFSKLVRTTGLSLKGIHCTAKVVLVGMKIDVQQREVSHDEGEALAKQWGCTFLECSAKADVRVGLMRQWIAEQSSRLTRSWSSEDTSRRTPTPRTSNPRAPPRRIQNFGNCMMVFELLMDTCISSGRHFKKTLLNESSFLSSSHSRASGQSTSSRDKRSTTRLSTRSGNSSSNTNAARGTNPPRGSLTDPMLQDDGYSDNDFGYGTAGEGPSASNQRGRRGTGGKRAKKTRSLNNVVRNTLTISELYPKRGCPLCFALCNIKSYQISSAQQSLLVSTSRALSGVLIGIATMTLAGAVLIFQVVTSVPDTPDGEAEGIGSGFVLSSLQALGAILSASGAGSSIISVSASRVERGKRCWVILQIVLLVLSIIVQFSALICFLSDMSIEPSNEPGNPHGSAIRFFRDMLPEGQSALEIFFLISLCCNSAVQVVSMLVGLLLLKSVQPTEESPYIGDADNDNLNSWTSYSYEGDSQSKLGRDRHASQ